ncbi:c-type cytochrome [Martelella mediterranea]|uniref:Cytochrome c n=1 Tax=Martelella mediterranea TaxID=293089 RepID=A0A4R3NJG6_9HYPH|nr:cytochrome c family protein [Martelella mediterranea]TCT33086.1 cytochrome c [Martelella mediterranea]
MKFNLNMVLASLLGTIFVLMTVSFVSEAVFDPRLPEKEGYAIAVPEEPASGKPVEKQETPIAVLLANASADAGTRVFKRCQACHTDTEGGPNKVGPNLWDIVNRPVASHEGFSYSAAMKEYANGGETLWTYENLDAFIKAPKKDVPGTAMGFAGLSDDEDRADLIAYLSTMSNDPVPFPEPEPEKTADASGTATTPEGDETTPAEQTDAASGEPADAGKPNEEAPGEGGDDASEDGGSASQTDAASQSE